MAINTNENLLFSKKHSKQKIKSTKIEKSDLASFTGVSIYDVGKKDKIDSTKLKNSFLSNVSFAGSSNAVSFGSGGYSGYSGYTSNTNSSQNTQQTQSSNNVQGANRADIVNDDFNVDDLFETERIKGLNNKKQSLMKQYKDVQKTILELEVKKKEAIELLSNIRKKVHEINIEIINAEEEELFGK